MNSSLKWILALAVVSQAQIASAIDVDSTKGTTTGDNAAGGNIINTLDKMLGYFIGLLYFVAVVYALYAGLMILTAGGDEEKVKKGKTTLIQAVIGLAVIFLASQIVTFVIGLGTTLPA